MKLLAARVLSKTYARFISQLAIAALSLWLRNQGCRTCRVARVPCATRRCSRLGLPLLINHFSDIAKNTNQSWGQGGRCLASFTNVRGGVLRQVRHAAPRLPRCDDARAVHPSQLHLLVHRNVLHQVVVHGGGWLQCVDADFASTLVLLQPQCYPTTPVPSSAPSYRLAPPVLSPPGCHLPPDSMARRGGV